MAGSLSPSTGTLLRGLAVLAASVLVLWFALAADHSSAKNLRGTQRGEKINGTKGPDKINGMSGNDKIKGKGGNDTLNGARVATPSPATRAPTRCWAAPGTT
jgi:Ca2+-binding RTX toxin-like protein